MNKTETTPSTEFEALYDIIQRLREPDGCDWDRKQTASMVKDYILEETYELMEAVIDGNPAAVGEESGDLLFLILFLIRIYEENGRMTLSAVLQQINSKMIRRHPHVFAGEKVSGVDDILKNWDAIKAQEPNKKKRTSRLDGIPVHLPALARAFALQKKAAKTGFDWPTEKGVFDKIREEVDELEAEVDNGSREKQEEELGDILFSLVNLARHRALDPESALIATNKKFSTRFRFIETEAEKQNTSPEALSLEEMDRYWNQAKNSTIGDKTDSKSVKKG